MRKLTSGVWLLVLLFAVSAVHAQKFDERFNDWPVELKINGRLVLCCGDYEPAMLADLFDNQRRVRICLIEKAKAELAGSLAAALVPVSSSVTITRHEKDDKTKIETDDCETLILVSGEEDEERATKLVRESADLLRKFVDGGGTLAVDGRIVPLLGKAVLNGDDNVDGIGLVPDALIHVDSAESDSVAVDWNSALTARPRSVGMQLESGTTLLFSGRNMLVMGDGAATFHLPSSEFLPARTQTIRKSSGRRQAPEDFVVDWTEWRRDSIERTLDQFPPAVPEEPFVKNGTLMIIGGGGMPGGMMEEFVEAAGGEQARLVYVPCSESDDVSGEQGMLRAWEQMGVASATMIHTKDRNKANTDEEFLAPLKDATGIMFGGGRQWNFSDSYYGTKAHELMKGVLERGGVIIGSSAGASIQARYLARATPIGNFRIMAPGYERGGLGFIGGVAIDQHFSQRGRQKDMTELVHKYPQLLGIGLDEATAIVVQKSKAEIVGRGKVYFYDCNQPVVEGQPDYTALPNGSFYDLAERKVLVDSSKPDALTKDQ